MNFYTLARGIDSQRFVTLVVLRLWLYQGILSSLGRCFWALSILLWSHL
jgi:hypothetical protein